LGSVLSEENDNAHSIGPYLLLREVGRGGLASVCLGRLRKTEGSVKTVAIKRLHPVFAEDPEFMATFTDEARRVARVRHANIVSVLDVVAAEGELLLVMDYVLGETLSHLVRDAGKQRIAMPRRVLVTIMLGVLSGLEAAHETRDERGASTEVLHGDVSPHDVLLGLDGVPKVYNFGLTKGVLRERLAAESGQIKGKHAYMSPEMLTGGRVDRRTDVYSAGIMLWEGLTGRRLYDAKISPTASDIVARMRPGGVAPPSTLIASTPKALDEIVMKALCGSPEDRFRTAREMGEALEKALPAIPSRLVGEWVAQVAGTALQAMAAELSEHDGAPLPPPSATPESVAGEPAAAARAKTSLIDLGAFASMSAPPTDPGDPLLQPLPRPPALPRASGEKAPPRPTAVLAPPAVAASPRMAAAPPIAASPPVAAAPPVGAPPAVAASPPVIESPTLAESPPVAASPLVAESQPVAATPPVVAPTLASSRRAIAPRRGDATPVDEGIFHISPVVAVNPSARASGNRASDRQAPTSPSLRVRPAEARVIRVPKSWVWLAGVACVALAVATIWVIASR
jgi:eukaryotic-like serine/threonine-protein kinase